MLPASIATAVEEAQLANQPMQSVLTDDVVADILTQGEKEFSVGACSACLRTLLCSLAAVLAFWCLSSIFIACVFSGHVGVDPSGPCGGMCALST